MLRHVLLCPAVLMAPGLALANGGKSEFDSSRRVLVGHGQGAPDLNAPPIAVASDGGVSLVGSTDHFAEEVKAKKPERFSVTVIGTSANTVDAELGQQ